MSSNSFKLISAVEAVKVMTDKQVKNASTSNLRYAEFFDRQAYAQAGQNTIQFFGRNPANVSYDESNLRSGKSEISSSQCFIVCGISCHFEPGADQTPSGAPIAATLPALDDFLKVERSGRLVFKTGSREDYVENGPLLRFPPMVQPLIGGALADTTTAAGNAKSAILNVVLAGDMYPITPKIIMPGDQFEFSAQWAAPVVVSAAGIIEGRLYGYLADLR